MELKQENAAKLCRSQLMLFAKNLKEVLLFDTIPSTNTLAKQLAEKGADECTAVIAENQTGGRGRLGRSFFSPNGGIYMSIILRPKLDSNDSLFITTAAAVAVAKAVEEISKRECKIKWVNDIYIADKKICGILTEGAINAKTGKLDYAVLGIGVNLTVPKFGFPDEIKDIAGSVFEENTVDSKTKAYLIGKITEYFFGFYNNISLKEFMDEYRNRSFLNGKDVVYTRDGVTYSATVAGIDDNAALILEKDGETIKLQAGEVSVRAKN